MYARLKKPGRPFQQITPCLNCLFDTRKLAAHLNLPFKVVYKPQC